MSGMFGITNDTRGANLKKFRPNPNVNGGLCIMALTDIDITEAEVDDDSSMATFRGLKIPRINFRFESRLDPKGVKTSHYTHSFLPIEHTVDNNQNPWRVNVMFGFIKHLHDVLTDNANLTKAQQEKLVIDYPGTVDGMFADCDPTVVVEAYRTFFKNVLNHFKGSKTAMYLDDKGQPIILWGKLILTYDGKEVNNGDFGFPRYPGDGFFEKWNKDVPPSIYVNIQKGESIIPNAKANAGAPIVPGVTAPSTAINKPSDIPDFMRDSSSPY